MPPANTSTSAPSISPIGQGRPNGPRTPRTSPKGASQIACVARPTARTVCTSGPSPPGSPLIEIGTSPVPNAESIVNCPGANARRAPARGWSSSVQVSEVSCRFPATVNGTGTIGPDSGAPPAKAVVRASGDPSMAVDIEELQLRRLQAFDQRRRKSSHELIAKLVVGLALAAQAGAVEGHHARRFARAAIELQIGRASGRGRVYFLVIDVW